MILQAGQQVEAFEAFEAVEASLTASRELALPVRPEKLRLAGPTLRRRVRPAAIPRAPSGARSPEPARLPPGSGRARAWHRRARRPRLGLRARSGDAWRRSWRQRVA